MQVLYIFIRQNCHNCSGFNVKERGDSKMVRKGECLTLADPYLEFQMAPMGGSQKEGKVGPD